MDTQLGVMGPEELYLPRVITFQLCLSSRCFLFHLLSRVEHAKIDDSEFEGCKSIIVPARHSLIWLILGFCPWVSGQMSVTGVSVLAGLVQYQQPPRCFLVSCGPSFCQHPAGYSRPLDSIPYVHLSNLTRTLESSLAGHFEIIFENRDSCGVDLLVT